MAVDAESTGGRQLLRQVRDAYRPWGAGLDGPFCEARVARWSWHSGGSLLRALRGTPRLSAGLVFPQPLFLRRPPAPPGTARGGRHVPNLPPAPPLGTFAQGLLPP